MKGKVIKSACIVLVLSIVIFMFSRCSIKSNVQSSKQNNVKSVKGQVIKKESYLVSLSYPGYVAAKDVKKFSFEAGGRVKDVLVEKGEHVVVGQALAELETSNIQLEVDNAKKNIVIMNNAIKQAENDVEKINLAIKTENINLKKNESTHDSNITKLTSAYKLKKNNFERIKSLYNEGIVSLQEYENVQSSFETAGEDLKNAQSNKINDSSLQKNNISKLEKDLELANLKLKDSHIKLEQSNIALEQSMKKLENSTLTSTIEGVVSDVLVKTDEMAASGSPVVSVSSKEQVINIGVPVEEYPKIKQGTKISIESSKDKFVGIIDKVSLYPDEATRTYNVEVIPEKSELALSSLVNVEIPIDKKQGYLIPIKSILNINDVNYVYSVKKEADSNYYCINPVEVIIGKTYGGKVLVENIKSDVMIITEGVENIKQSDIVQIVE